MTEVPEHLLRRSRERRAALGLGGGAPAESSATAEGAAPAPAEEAPAPAAREAPAPPAEVKPEPPKPDPVYIQAAKSRKRVPYWAMAVLAILPIWGLVYFQTLEPVEEEADIFTQGAAVYDSCASCHGANGEGGSGPAFVDGAITETWPDPLDHMMWVRLGSDGWPAGTYGAQDTTKSGGMPAWPDLDDAQLAQVVLHERTLGGEEITEDTTDEGLQTLVAIAEGEMTFEEAGLGQLSQEAGVSEDELAGGG